VQYRKSDSRVPAAVLFDVFGYRLEGGVMDAFGVEAGLSAVG
jgi:hypothetical protein